MCKAFCLRKLFAMEKPVQVNFRMPAELKDKLEAAAKESGRSTTAEIVARLEESLNAPPLSSVVNALARFEYQLASKEVELRHAVLKAGILADMAEIALPLYRKILMRAGRSEQEMQPLLESINQAKADRDSQAPLPDNLEDDPAMQRWRIAAKRLDELLPPEESGDE